MVLFPYNQFSARLKKEQTFPGNSWLTDISEKSKCWAINQTFTKTGKNNDSCLTHVNVCLRAFCGFFINQSKIQKMTQMLKRLQLGLWVQMKSWYRKKDAILVMWAHFGFSKHNIEQKEAKRKNCRKTAIVSFIIVTVRIFISSVCPSLALSTWWWPNTVKCQHQDYKPGFSLSLPVSSSLQWLTVRRPDRSSPTGKIAHDTTVPSACRWRTPATSAPSSVSTSSRLRPTVA